MRKIFLLFLIVFSWSLSATNDLSDALKTLTKSISNLNQKISSHDTNTNDEKVIAEPFSFKPRKIHRMLDTTARLLNYELGMSALSVAMSWERDDAKNLNLVVSYNFTYSKKKVINALQEIVKNSYLLGATVKNASETIIAKTKDLKIVFDQIKNYDEKDFEKLRIKYLSIRNEIDHLKLYILLVKNQKNKTEQQITQFFKNISPTSVKVLSNKKRMHSELNIVQYFLERDFFLGKVRIDNKNIPYIYIGNSLRACSKCASLIDGQEYAGIKGINEIASDKELHRLFFYRKAQSHCYPRSYFIPSWSCSVNQTNATQLRKSFAELQYLDPKKKANAFYLKTLPISDAED